LRLLFVVHVDIVEGTANIRNHIVCGDSLPVRVDRGVNRVDRWRARQGSGGGAACSDRKETPPVRIDRRVCGWRAKTRVSSSHDGPNPFGLG
jgi:hypothetical protein